MDRRDGGGVVQFGVDPAGAHSACRRRPHCTGRPQGLAAGVSHGGRCSHCGGTCSVPCDVFGQLGGPKRQPRSPSQVVPARVQVSVEVLRPNPGRRPGHPSRQRHRWRGQRVQQRHPECRWGFAGAVCGHRGHGVHRLEPHAGGVDPHSGSFGGHAHLSKAHQGGICRCAQPSGAHQRVCARTRHRDAHRPSVQQREGGSRGVRRHQPRPQRGQHSLDLGVQCVFSRGGNAQCDQCGVVVVVGHWACGARRADVGRCPSVHLVRVYAVPPHSAVGGSVQCAPNGHCQCRPRVQTAGPRRQHCRTCLTGDSLMERRNCL